MDTLQHSATCYRFTLEGPIAPKARPRVTCRGTFMPPAYRNWKATAIAAFRNQAAHQGIISPMRRATITINLVGKHPRRSDCDNLAGSVLDALVQSRVLANDNLNCVPSLAIALSWSKASPIAEITLKIEL